MIFSFVVEDDSRSNSEATSLTCLAYVASMGDVDHAAIRVRASRASAFFLHPLPIACSKHFLAHKVTFTSSFPVPVQPLHRDDIW